VVAILSINARFDRPFCDRRPDRRKRSVAQTVRVLTVPLHKTPLLPLFERVPAVVWRSLAAAHIVGSVLAPIEAVAARGVRVHLIFGDHEWGLGALGTRGGKHFDALANHPFVTLLEVAGLDHSMFDPSARARVADLLRDLLEDDRRLVRLAPNPV
jgi:hypothetical protein